MMNTQQHDRPARQKHQELCGGYRLYILLGHRGSSALQVVQAETAEKNASTVAAATWVLSGGLDFLHYSGPSLVTVSHTLA